jgi:hypothetical protein
MLSLQSPEDVVNNALVRSGYKMRIGSLYDGSAASKCALDIYGQTRDELLRSADWGFAERDVVLAVLKIAPAGGYVPPTVWSSTYPILPWRYEYQYPLDVLKVRSIRRTTVFLPDYDPKPNVWRVANDKSFVPPQQVILCNVANAILVYTGQVTDPLTWEPSFTETLCASLARRLGPALVNLDAAKVEAGDEVATRQMAEAKEG